METTIQKEVTPDKIMQIGMGFWASKTLLVAVNMGLFSLLADKEFSGKEIQQHLKLNNRSLYDFLDALVALGFLKRKGIKETAIYSNNEDARIFLDQNKPTYVGGILEMANNRLFSFWNNLEEALKTGLPQNEAKKGGGSLFEIIYANPVKLKEFVNAMAGVQMGNFIAFAKQFDFTNYATLCDIGGAGGFLAAHVCIQNPQMKCTTFDLVPVQPIAQENITNLNLEKKVKVVSGDFFTEDFPKADVITMGNILHDWGKEDKLILIKKAYNALPKGGALVVIENIIDNNRLQNTFGLLMSLNMLIETEKGYDFSASDFEELAIQAGFQKFKILPLAGPTSAAIAYK